LIATELKAMTTAGTIERSGLFIFELSIPTPPDSALMIIDLTQS
jgi:hypothetical protein